MKKLGLDIGTVRIGIASSDPTNIIASVHSVYRRKTLKEDARFIASVRRKERKDYIDAVSASIILQNYIDKNKNYR